MKRMLTSLAAAVAMFANLPSEARAASVYDVMFLLDTSASATESGFSIGKIFASYVLNDFLAPHDTRVAVFSLSDNASTSDAPIRHLEFNDPGSADIAVAGSIIQNVVFERRSPLVEAGLLATYNAFREDGRSGATRLAFLIGDGRVSPNDGFLCEYRNFFGQEDIKFNVVNVGGNPIDADLGCVLEDTTDNVFQVSAFDTGARLAELIPAPAPVPVPASLPLLAFGIGTLAYFRRRKSA